MSNRHGSGRVAGIPYMALLIPLSIIGIPIALMAMIARRYYQKIL
jgi:hypothetical protein